MSVSVTQSVVLALFHAVAVAGIVYATMRGEIATNREAIIEHVGAADRHINSELISYRLNQIQQQLETISRENRDERQETR